VNAAGCPVISADINSGMSGNNGLGDPCVKSTITVAIGSYKYGHFLANAKDVIGSLTCAGIGIPVLDEPICLVPEKDDFASVLQHRYRNSHKGDYGYVGILAGCAEYSGAAKLANLSCAALRSGCGVSTLAVPRSLSDSVSPYLLESTLMAMPDDGVGHMVFDATALDELMKNRRALAVGMGWGRSSENERILTYLLTRYEGALVIDADGLNTLAEMDSSLLKTTRAKVFLTPHPKEFERLSGYSVKEILCNPVTLARQYASSMGVCVLLKGACTIVTDGEKGYLIDRGCAGMATAGSGDVLSGILAGLLGYAPANALTIACGAYLAGVAGELTEADSNAISMTASDTVQALPRAISMMI
jgi:NAD(P)H-hydrate epimerase